MEIISIKNFTKPYKEIYQIWNDEYGFIYPITEELFLRNTINHNGLLDDGSFIAMIDDKVIGFIFTKVWKHNHFILEYDSYGWISLLYIKPSERRKGIGSRLLKLAEDKLREFKKTKFYIGRDYQNFFPGLPFDFKVSLPWFEKRGYQTTYDTNDLIQTIDETNQPLPLYKNDFLIRFATKDDFPKLRKLFENNWPGRWLVEFEDYIAYNGTGEEYLIGLDGEKICAFCKVATPTTKTNLSGYSLTWRSRFPALGGIGPLGVDKEYRGQKLGYNIVAKAVNYFINTKVSHLIVDWTNLIEFYRLFGFEIWKSYKYLIKEEK